MNEFTPIAELIAWLLIAGLVVRSSWRNTRMSIGLVLAYLAALFFEHWIPALVYTFPWYQPVYDLAAAHQGFEQSLLGLIGFAVGVLWLSPQLQKISVNRAPSIVNKPKIRDGISAKPFVLGFYTVIGLLFYFVGYPLLKSIPTLGNIASVLVFLAQTGIIGLYFVSMKQGRRGVQLIVLLIGLSLPLVTVVRDGQAWFGVWSLIIIMMFVVTVTGRKWLAYLALALLFVVGISFFVTYFSVRPVIRQIVWYGQPDTDDRFATIGYIVDNFQIIDIYNPQHLNSIDIRFNQNSLIGYTIRNIDTGVRDYAYGGTIANAAIALIPRALWPEKPILGGGAASVGYYSGVTYSGNTAVPTGNVMELYINFGTVGVFIGFAILGAIISYLDFRVASVLYRRDFLAYGQWLVPSLGLMFPSNTIVMTFGLAITGVLTMKIVNLLIVSLVSAGFPKRSLFPALGGNSEQATD